LNLEPVSATSSADVTTLARIWTEACGRELTISADAVAYNLRPLIGGRQQGRIASVDGRPVGFVLASVVEDDQRASPPDMGWIDAIAVRPEEQRRGVGARLLRWAEDWLAEQGRTRWMLGASVRPFAPGLPSTISTTGFFRKHGYLSPPDYSRAWDLARSLKDYTTPATALRDLEHEVRPASTGDESALLDFLRREFPGRWRYEFEQFLGGGERLSDYMILWTDQGVDGFCLLTFEDSVRPLDRFFPWALPRPWGQLGSIGVSERRRGLGLGAVLLDAGLRRLRDTGVDGCVIDWTGLLDFYGKFGFTPYREYIILAKQVAQSS
jgi:GNAT superfamily N-acetyltransferase